MAGTKMKLTASLFILLCSIVLCKRLNSHPSRNLSSSGLPWVSTNLKDHLQSPIDVISSIAVKVDYCPLQLSAVNNNDVVCNIRNSGKGVTIQINSSDENLKPQLSGSFLKDKYIFESFHLHWGKKDYLGSEHFLNGAGFSMEGNMIMYKKSYHDYTNALCYKDGVVALTFFGQVCRNNKYLDNLLQYIPQIANSTSCSVKAASADPILWFLEGMNGNESADYFIYPGSLTIPPYTESVTFIVLPYQVPISHDQLQILRTILDYNKKPVLSNRRGIQPLRGRPILSASNIRWKIKDYIMLILHFVRNFSSAHPSFWKASITGYFYYMSAQKECYNFMFYDASLFIHSSQTA